jgi:hypothetical protein
MLDPIFAFFEKLISDFSWRRLAFVLLFCGAILGGLWMYEGYTGTFRLAVRGGSPARHHATANAEGRRATREASPEDTRTALAGPQSRS